MKLHNVSMFMMVICGILPALMGFILVGSLGLIIGGALMIFDSYYNEEQSKKKH